MASLGSVLLFVNCIFFATVAGQNIQDLDSNPTAARGNTITLQVTVPGNTNEMGEWYTNAGKVSDTSRTRYSIDGPNKRLTISNVQEADQTNYYYILGSLAVQGRLTVTSTAERYGNWGNWETTACSVTCGTGSQSQTRRRSCLSASCSADLEETNQITCERQRCPIAEEGVPQNLVSGVTVLKGQSVILALTAPAGVTQGLWFNIRGQITNSARTRYSVQGNSHRLTITNVQDTDEGTYFYSSGTFYQQGNLTVVDSVTEPSYGQWNNWQDYTSCSVTCGNGVVTQQRTRSCLSGSCTVLQETRQGTCSRQSCGGATYGQWNNWQDYTSCSVTCGNGVVTQQRTRSCLSGSCTVLQETRQGTCSRQSCGGRWSEWGQWQSSSCSRTCGGGTLSQVRSRVCQSGSCTGSSTDSQTVSCGQGSCSGGAWTEWSQWQNSSCSRTCGGGILTQIRRRVCQSGPCPGNLEQTQQASCGQGTCTGTGGTPQNLESGVTAVIGGTVIIQVTTPPATATGVWYADSYGELKNGGRFSISVDGQNHRLTITNVEENDKGKYYYYYNGQLVDGLLTVESTGTTYGQWNNWQDYTSCSVSCGNGVVTQQRTRSCLSGSCTDLQETRQGTCSRQSCGGATYGQWNNWQDYTSCSVTCGNGVVTQQRTRSCLSGSCTVLQETRQGTCSRQSCGATYSNWSSWQDSSSCSVTCGYGSKTQSRSRSCRSGACGELQQTRNATCYQGSCPGDQSDLCATANQYNGVGYRYHPTDCNKYIQCYTSSNGATWAVYRVCPFGQFWNQDLFKCENSYGVKCPIDRCKDDCRMSYKVAGSCSAYVQCYEDKSEFQCCPRNFMFVPGKGCRFNMECDDFCNNPWVNTNYCLNRPVDNNPTQFRMFAGNFGWQGTSCPANSVFDILSCECQAKESDCSPTYDVTFQQQSSLVTRGVVFINNMATFNRNSRLMLNVTAQEQSYPLGMAFRYRETAVTSDMRVLVSSPNCNRKINLMMALNEDKELQIHLTTWYGDANILTLSTQGMDEWKTVTLGYDGFSLRAQIQSGNKMVMGELNGQRSAGMTSILECGVAFGAGESNGDNNGFIGDVNMLSMYNCDPTLP